MSYFDFGINKNSDGAMENEIENENRVFDSQCLANFETIITNCTTNCQDTINSMVTFRSVSSSSNMDEWVRNTEELLFLDNRGPLNNEDLAWTTIDLEHSKPPLISADSIHAREKISLNTVPSLTELRRSKRTVLAVASMACFVDYYLWCFVAPLLPQIIDERTAITGESERAWAQGALFASFAAGALLAAPLVGIYSDRWGQRYLPMMVGLAALCTSTVAFTFARGIVWLVLARFLQGMASSTTEVMSLTIVGDSFEQDELGAAVGVVNAAFILGLICGLIAGSNLAEHYGLDAPFYLGAGLVGVDVIGRLFVIPAPPRRMGKEETKDTSILDLFRNQEIFITLTIEVVLQILFSALDAAIPLLMETNLGMPATLTSYVMIAVMIPQVIMSPSVGKLSDTMSKRKLIVGGLILLGIGYPMIPIFAAFADQQRLVWLIVGASITGINFTIVRNPVSTRLSDLVGSIGSSSYGRVFALYSMCTNFGILLGPVILDGLMTSIGSIPAWCIFGAISILSAPLFVVLTKPEGTVAPDDAVSHQNDIEGGGNVNPHR